MWFWWACVATDPTTSPPTGDTETVPGCPSTGGPRVETSTGCVLGSTTPSGREQFLGIPYAEPPVGARRFAPTEPVAPWSEPLQATAFGPPCVQFSDATFDDLGAGDGQEDCLTLNVFRPAAAHDLPLMVFVHGGGYLTGDASAPYLSDDPALAEAAVVVSINYRLGPLGFLAHPSLSEGDPDGVSGNNGVQDMLVALQWASDNADALGGDPRRVIVFGESAGGLQTCAALASPRGGGLFDAAIIQSGPCGSLALPLRDPPPLVVGGEAQGEDFAAEVGCADADCLRALPVETLVTVGQSEVGPGGGGWHWQPWMDGVWMPQTSVPAAFLSGDWNQVPVLATVNRDEGTLFTAGLAPDQAALDEWIALYALVLGVDDAALAAMYDPAVYGSTEAAYAALYGDVIFVCPTVWQQEVLAAQVPARGAYWVYAGADVGGLGAYHGSEMPFVMGTYLSAATRDQLALSERLRAAWRTMADPEPAIDGIGAWPTVDEGWVENDLPGSVVIDAPRPEACAFFAETRANAFRD